MFSLAPQPYVRLGSRRGGGGGRGGGSFSSGSISSGSSSSSSSSSKGGSSSSSKGSSSSSSKGGSKGGKSPSSKGSNNSIRGSSGAYISAAIPSSKNNPLSFLNLRSERQAPAILSKRGIENHPLSFLEKFSTTSSSSPNNNSKAPMKHHAMDVQLSKPPADCSTSCNTRALLSQDGPDPPDLTLFFLLWSALCLLLVLLALLWYRFYRYCYPRRTTKANIIDQEEEALETDSLIDDRMDDDDGDVDDDICMSCRLGFDWSCVVY